MPHPTVDIVPDGGLREVPARIGRFRLEQLVGHGTFGAVYKAHDTTHGDEVAVKLLRRYHPNALFRFKLEFRQLADLSHENLVQLYELACEDGQWFVVMEFVEGVDVLRHLWRAGVQAGATLSAESAIVPTESRDSPAPGAWGDGEPPPHPLRLDGVRACFGQLVRGLVALHETRRLHRDVKPSNVRVTPQGRLVLLDFGLVSEIGETLTLLGGRGLGTPGYMSPEQAAGRQLTPASDWYSVGIMLLEVLAPWRALTGASAEERQELTELVRFAQRMVARDPDARPTTAEIVDRFGAPQPATSARPSARPPELPFVGRARELERLDRALERCREGPTIVRIAGASGVGKTAVVSRWCRSLPGDVWLLRGRSFEHEVIPFKGIDAIVDALADQLSARTNERRAELLPPTLDPLPRMFPVLAGLGPEEREELDLEPHVLRDRGFARLDETLARIARTSPVVLCMDDVQWADADSAGALTQLLHDESRNRLVVLAHVEDPGAAFLKSLDEWLARNPGVVVEDIRLGELDDAEAHSLATSLLPQAPAPILDRVVREGAGFPFLIGRLATEIEERGSADGEVSASADHVFDHLPPGAREVIEIVAVASSPLPASVVALAAGLDHAQTRRVLFDAERQRLVVARRGEEGRDLEMGHDWIRRNVVGQIPADQLEAIHGKIVGALLATGRDEPEVLLPHLLGAQDRERAAQAALQVARRAENGLAFERAADHYALVLLLGYHEGRRLELLERRAEALANAGRAAGAAQCLDEAAALATADAATKRRLLRRAGELWLRSGYVDQGRAALQSVFDSFGIRFPSSAAAATRTAMFGRLRALARSLSPPPSANGPATAEDLERLDALWAATTGLSMLDWTTADALGVQHLLGALDVGDPARLARALGYEASFEAAIGGPLFERRLKTIVAAMERAVERADAPYLRAWMQSTLGVVAWFRGEWKTAWAHCSSAASIYRGECRGAAWERVVADVYGFSALTYLGAFDVLERLVPEDLRSARDRGDLYAVTNLAFYDSAVRLARGQPDEAIRGVEDAIRPFPRSRFLSIHYGIDYAIAQGELYRDRPDRAWDVVERGWPQWNRAGLTRARSVRLEIAYLRARVALAVLRSTPKRERAAAARRVLSDSLRRLERDPSPPAPGLHRAARAAEHALAGRVESAITEFADAATAFERAHMSLHAAAARHHRGQLAKEDGGGSLDAWPGIADTRRFFALAVSGSTP